ncbi:MAG: sugar ABC transporter permease [Clostridia bacterium]|nr:sugar ABC transporter permease [Clostridia bacterium]
MKKIKKVGLGQNNFKSKLFYTLLALLPSLQFLFFYVFVNLNSFSLAFKIFPEGILNEYKWDFDNFSRWFTNDLMNKEMTAAINVSLKSYLISMITGIPLGLFFSYYMAKKMPGAKLFRILLFMPSILSATVLATMYKMVTDRVLGGSSGLFGVNFWDADHRYGSMMFFNIFVSFGTTVLMYTNKMNAIAPEIIESAHLDGANGIKEFWYIILPQIFPIMQVFLISNFAAIFTHQLNVMILFGYDPGAEVQPLGYLLWRGVLRAGGNVTQMGPYAALGLMITFIVVPLTFLLRWALQKIGWKEE